MNMLLPSLNAGIGKWLLSDWVNGSEALDDAWSGHQVLPGNHADGFSPGTSFELMAGPTRLELATSDVTGRRSNQLNYDPALIKSAE
jgi:hypothetical protein